MSTSRRRRDDAGQSTAEYVGLAAVVVVVIGALVGLAPNLLAGARPVVDAAYCQLSGSLGGGGCAEDAPAAAPELPGTGGSSEPPVPRTPRQVAEAGDYVALGDSYSAGEGAFDYQPGTDQDDNRCHRSDHAYGQQVYDGGHFAGDFHFGACSGGVVEDYFGPNQGNQGEPPQREHITDDTSLITISMGGNDFGFADVLSHCMFHNCATEDYRGQLEAVIAAEAAQLVEMYRDMRERAGDDARIIVVGYPHLFDVNGGHGLSLSSPIRAAERRFLNEVTDLANQAIQDSIAQADANVEFVDIRDVFAGHEVGTADPWIHDLSLKWDWGNTGPDPASFHPTRAGQDAIRDAVNAQIDEGP